MSGCTAMLACVADATLRWGEQPDFFEKSGLFSVTENGARFGR